MTLLKQYKISAKYDQKKIQINSDYYIKLCRSECLLSIATAY